MADEITQTPVGPQQAETRAEAESPPSESMPDIAQPETGILDGQPEVVAPEAPPRTFSQEEVSKIQSSRDQEMAGMANALAGERLQNQIARAEAVEVQYYHQDLRSVDEGTMTSEQAGQRAAQRKEAVKSYIGNQQAQEQQTASYNAMAQQGEQLGRIMAANDFAKQYSVDADMLISNKDLRTPDQMRAGALELALEKSKAGRTGTESYDSGRVSTSSASLDNMSAQEKIAWALAHPPKVQK
jgi:hypothetical protein